MATFEEIEEVRLAVSDPDGAIDLVDSPSALPSTAASQTAYRYNGAYYMTTKVGAVVDSDFSIATLRVSDERISAWIDSDDIATAKCNALKQILAVIGGELRIARIQTGAESTEYNSLKDVYATYRDLLELCSETKREAAGNSTGRYAQTESVTIAGGDL